MSIKACRDHLIALLTADAFFTDPDPKKIVTIVTKKAGDVDAMIAEKLQEIGVGLLVSRRPSRLLQSDSLDLDLELRFALLAVENPIVNETGKTADDIEQAVMEILHGKPNGVSINYAGTLTRFMVDPRTADQPIAPPAKKSFLNLQLVNINTTIALTPR